ncbi:unnamed protein product [Toxocara canis]|uniref:TFIIS central domain-containing protein n=1 Tax=Toxocara canis TaxID=6265 RepID=A0A183UKJ9_TOXCA|nr:unnamed protein product [Toxocara canis]
MSNVNAEVSSSRTDANVDVATTNTEADKDQQGARKRTKSMDNDDVEEVIRKRCILMLLKCLGESEKAEVVAKKVELAVYEEFGDANDHRYRSRVRSRISNLTRNPAIAQQLIDGTICPEKFAKMTAEELATPQLKKLREHLSEDTMEEHMMGENEKVGIGNIKKSDNAI